MAPGKGYILMSDFTTHPSAFPSFGTIIQDPLRPNDTTPLSELKESEQPETIPHQDKHKMVLSSNFEANGSVWAQFCEKVVHASVGASVGSDTVVSYETELLETRYLKKPLDGDEVKARTKEINVQDAMNVGGLKGSPVFVVTGLKVARGFKRFTKVTSKRSADASAGAQVTEDVSVGGEAHASSGEGFSEELEALPAPEDKPDKQDIVFAYQLHIVAKRQWWELWKKPFKMTKYEPDGGFSSVGQGEGASEVDLVLATEELLRDIMKQNYDDVGATTARDVVEGQEEVVFCVVPQKSC